MTGEWRTETLSPHVKVTHYVPTGYATSLQPVERWAMAYVHPNPDQYIVGHIVTSTRSQAWDEALGIWYNKLESGGEYWYVPYKSRDDGRPKRSLSRHSAIRKLREERGVRVVRVQVVAL